MIAPPPSDTRTARAAQEVWSGLLKQARTGDGVAGAARRVLPLQDFHVALISDAQARGAAHVLTDAARELGARVAQLRPIPDAATSEIRMLARLYSAIACEGLNPPQVAQLVPAGLPMCNGLASADHPDRMLADMLALREAAATALPGLTLGVIDDEHSSAVSAWRSAAELSGLRVKVLTPQRSGNQSASDLAQAWGADALWDTRRPPGPDGRPTLWLRQGPHGQGVSLGAEQATQHRHLVKVLLMRQLG